MSNLRVTISGERYGLFHMRADEAAALGLQVAAIIAKPLSKILGSDDTSIAQALKEYQSEGEDSVDEGSIMKIVSLFLGVLPDMDMERVSSIFRQVMKLSVSHSDGKFEDDDIRDTHFQNHRGNYYPVAIWAVWENCKDFLLGAIPGLKGIFLKSQDPLDSQSQSQRGESLNTSSPNSTNRDCVPMPTLRKGV